MEAPPPPSGDGNPQTFLGMDANTFKVNICEFSPLICNYFSSSMATFLRYVLLFCVLGGLWGCRQTEAAHFSHENSRVSVERRRRDWRRRQASIWKTWTRPHNLWPHVAGGGQLHWDGHVCCCRSCCEECCRPRYRPLLLHRRTRLHFIGWVFLFLRHINQMTSLHDSLDPMRVCFQRDTLKDCSTTLQNAIFYTPQSRIYFVFKQLWLLCQR